MKEKIDEKGKRTRETGEGSITLPLAEPPEELTYSILKHFRSCTPREIAWAIGWSTSRVQSNLKKLQKNDLVTMSPCFTTKLTWIRPPEDRVK